MKKANMIISKDFKVGKTDDRLFGSFVEHMGAVIYNGIYEPDHPLANEQGYRTDVLDLAKDLNLSVVRYPGGNFTSGYDWEDGIGPKESRPVKTDIAWKQIETNQFGLNEFIDWLKHLQAEPIMTINLGTKGIEDAKNIIEYCNFSGGTEWSELRKLHGIEEPYHIKTWCLGNELDGDWQIAQKTADDYGKLARETAKAMKWMDKDIELVAVGSSARHMPTFPTWDQTVLTYTYEHADYLSLHYYIDKGESDTANYLALPLDFERHIEEVIATCDYVKSKKRTDKVMYLSFDEWNVWRKPDVQYEEWKTGSPLDWVKFHMEDALVFASAMMAILRHADRIKIACQSLLVNTIPMILTEKNGKAWRNPTYFPFYHMSKFGRGEVLRTNIDTPTYDSSQFTDIPFIDSVTVFNEEKRELNVFAVNRSEEKTELGLDFRDFEDISFTEHITMNHEQLDAVNTADNQLNVSPYNLEQSIEIGTVTIVSLEPYSWNVIRFKVK